MNGFIMKRIFSSWSDDWIETLWALCCCCCLSFIWKEEVEGACPSICWFFSQMAALARLKGGRWTNVQVSPVGTGVLAPVPSWLSQAHEQGFVPKA